MHLAQLAAETVVSSFTERKLHPGMNTMVPTVLVDEESVTGCLYDAEHDLLIFTSKVIWRDTDDNQLSKAGVTLLWTLSTSVTPSMCPAESTQLKISTKCKMAASILFQGLQFLCGRENSVHQRFVLLKTGLQQIYLRSNSGGLQVRAWKGCGQLFFSSSLTTEIRKIAAFWLGNVADYLKVGLHDK